MKFKREYLEQKNQLVVGSVVLILVVVLFTHRYVGGLRSSSLAFADHLQHQYSLMLELETVMGNITRFETDQYQLLRFVSDELGQTLRQLHLVFLKGSLPVSEQLVKTERHLKMNWDMLSLHLDKIISHERSNIEIKKHLKQMVVQTKSFVVAIDQLNGKFLGKGANVWQVDELAKIKYKMKETSVLISEILRDGISNSDIRLSLFNNIGENTSDIKVSFKALIDGDRSKNIKKIKSKGLRKDLKSLRLLFEELTDLADLVLTMESGLGEMYLAIDGYNSDFSSTKSDSRNLSRYYNNYASTSSKLNWLIDILLVAAIILGGILIMFLYRNNLKKVATEPDVSEPGISQNLKAYEYLLNFIEKMAQRKLVQVNFTDGGQALSDKTRDELEVISVLCAKLDTEVSSESESIQSVSFDVLNEIVIQLTELVDGVSEFTNEINADIEDVLRSEVKTLSNISDMKKILKSNGLQDNESIISDKSQLATSESGTLMALSDRARKISDAIKENIDHINFLSLNAALQIGNSDKEMEMILQAEETQRFAEKIISLTELLDRLTIDLDAATSDELNSLSLRNGAASKSDGIDQNDILTQQLIDFSDKQKEDIKHIKNVTLNLDRLQERVVRFSVVTNDMLKYIEKLN